MRIEQEGGCQCAGGGAKPKASVDDEVNPSAIFCRYEFVDGGIDRCIFATDAKTSDQPKEGKTPEETAELRLLSAALPKAIDRAAKAMGADTLSNKALLDVLEGTAEAEVDTIIQRIRQIMDDSEAK